MFARASEWSLLVGSRALPTRNFPVGKRWTPKMVAGVGAVRRSARLIAAVASENSGRPNLKKPIPQKLVGVISGSKRSTRVSRTKFQVKHEENEAHKETAATVVDAESVSGTNEAQPKQIKPLRRTKSLKKFPSRDLETKLWELGFRNVAGVDEAGRGPLAGPVVAAACIIPASVTIPGVDDSKKLTETQREELYHYAKPQHLGVEQGVGRPAPSRRPPALPPFVTRTAVQVLLHLFTIHFRIY